MNKTIKTQVIRRITDDGTVTVIARLYNMTSEEGVRVFIRYVIGQFEDDGVVDNAQDIARLKVSLGNKIYPDRVGGYEIIDEE